MKALRIYWSICIACAALFSSGTALAVGVDFNTPGDLANNFSLNVNLATVKYTQVAAGGIGNSGAVDLLPTTDADHTTAVYTPSSYSLMQAGDSVTVSAFLLRQVATNTSTPFAMLGLVSDPNERMDGGSASNSYASIRLSTSTTATPTDIFLQTETKVNGGGRLRTTPGITATLTAGNWYKMTAKFDYTSATDLSMSASLEDWGTTAAAPLSTVLTFGPSNIALAGLDQVNGDGSVWAGFRVFHEGGVDLLDNFAVVPEPVTGALLGAAMMVHGLRRRRAG